MTGKITVGTIQDTDGNTVASTYVTNAIPKAFSQFNGDGTVAIHKSVNVSSMTDTGTGFYDTNVTSNMLDTDYIVSNNGNDNAAAATWHYETGANKAAYRTTSVMGRIATVRDAVGAWDITIVGVVIYGDLA